MIQYRAGFQRRIGRATRWLRVTVAASLGLAVILAGLAQAQTTAWPPIDLGTLGGTSVDTSVANGVNNRGDVVGSSSILGQTHAFLWTTVDGMRDLGTLGGAFSAARGINDAREVVGASDLGPGVAHAFLWTDAGGMVDLGTLGGATSDAVAINNLGQVVGTSLVPSGERHPFLWTAAAGMTDLASVLGAGAVPKGINDAGQIVGNRTAAPPEAFSWTPSGGLVLLPRAATALGVNNAGAVVGSFSHPQYLYPWTYVWTAAGGIAAVGFEANGIDINDAGEIVANPYEGPPGSFVYTSAGYFVLPPLPRASIFTQRVASAISNAGVVGFAGTAPLLPGNPGHAVLWCKPQAPSITDITASPSVLWPPNHKMVRVDVDYTVTPSCGATTTLSVEVTDSGHVHGEGNGGNDAVVVDAHTVLLRAERAGGGDGRTYTIWIRAIDSAGRVANEAVTVTVPANRRRGSKDK